MLNKSCALSKHLSFAMIMCCICLCCHLFFFYFFYSSQAKQDELEELNKELRQCNLQQFIQQAGVLPAHSHSRTDLQEQLEQLELTHLFPEEYSNGSKGTSQKD